MNSDNIEVQVGQHTFQFSEEEILKLEILETKGQEILASFEGKKLAFSESFFENKSGQFWLKGEVFELEIRNEIDVLVRKMGLSNVSKQQTKQLQSPMPGLVFKILVKKGEEVKEKQPLMILEAMKMENVLLADQDGIIAEIDCTEGDAVEKKQTLLRFE